MEHSPTFPNIFFDKVKSIKQPSCLHIVRSPRTEEKYRSCKNQNSKEVITQSPMKSTVEDAQVTYAELITTANPRRLITISHIPCFRWALMKAIALLSLSPCGVVTSTPSTSLR